VLPAHDENILGEKPGQFLLTGDGRGNGKTADSFMMLLLETSLFSYSKRS